ncbi:hypothetical protein A3K72_00660 [Candidatus Woesearchaeota archaeon RBG_13_36_6]|nr:MAG: hypothetical protein A3K72_00660 [Candidatus Woesearchaeota archaeon RBG_13_36_6]
MTCNFSGDILIFVFLSIFISVLMIFEHIMWWGNLNKKQKRFYKIGCFVVSCIGIAIYYFYENSVAEINIINDSWIIFLAIIIPILLWTTFFYAFTDLKSEKENIFSSILFCIAIATFLMGIVFNPIFGEFLYENHFKDNVVAGIFFYKNETNPNAVDISMFVINRDSTFSSDGVIFKLDFVNESNIVLSIRNNGSDISGNSYQVFKDNNFKGITRPNNSSNYTRIEWSKNTGFENGVGIGFKDNMAYNWVNFTVEYDKNVTVDYVIHQLIAPTIELVKNDYGSRVFGLSDFTISRHYELKKINGKPKIEYEKNGYSVVSIYSKVFEQIKNA